MTGEHDAIDRDRALLMAVHVAVAAFRPRASDWPDESADERRRDGGTLDLSRR
jgi:hypothetical protein